MLYQLGSVGILLYSRDECFTHPVPGILHSNGKTTGSVCCFIILFLITFHLFESLEIMFVFHQSHKCRWSQVLCVANVMNENERTLYVNHCARIKICLILRLLSSSVKSCLQLHP